jgi:hypothetical protein
MSNNHNETNEPRPIRPSQEDFAAAVQDYAKEHGKTVEQMRNLPTAEAAHVYRLAQAYAMVRMAREYRDH